MINQLSTATKYLTSFWRSESPITSHTLSKQSDFFQQQVTDVSTQRLNQLISNIMPGCTKSEAVLRTTQEGKLSFYSESTGTIIFSDEKTMDEWLADQQVVDIWEIEDQRTERSEVVYKLQRNGEWGYDTFKTENALYDRLRADYGVFWKFVDPERDQTSYIRFKTGIFGNYYEKVDPANLIYVANNLELKTGARTHTTTSPAPSRTSWGKGIAACVLGGLLLSAGRSWIQNSSENTLSNAIAMMKGTLGSAAFKAALVFQMSAIAAVSRHGGGPFAGALLAGMMFLPELVKSQSLCPQLVGSYDTPGFARGVSVFGNYAFVADYNVGGLQILDISNVTTPTLAGFYNTTGVAYGITVSGNYIYVADEFSGLQIIEWNVPLPCPTSSSSSITSTSSTSSSSFSTSSTTSFSTFQITTENLSSTSETNNIINWTLVGLISATAGVIICSVGAIIASVIVVAIFLNKRRRKNEKQIEIETNRRTDKQDLPMLESIISDRDNLKSFKLKATVKRGHKEIGEKYYQLSTLIEEEARDIYLQTGYTIIFPKVQKKLTYAIGRGNFGAIKIAQRIEDGQYVASKKIQGEANMRASEAEADRQREAAGENILPIYNTIELPKALYHFMPLAGLGDGCAIQQRLAALKNAKKKAVTEILNFVAKDLLTGLKTLHGKGMCHLDIKPDNLVFTKEGIGYITDFGCAKEAAIAQIPADALGDTRYFSPERLQACGNGGNFDGEKADLWAAGMVLLQMIKNMSPMQLLDMPGPLKLRIQQCDANYFHEKLELFPELSTAQEGTIFWVIRRLLDPNPKTRFTAQKALESSCIKALDDYDFQRENIFNDLRKETLAKSSAVKKEEINLNDYEVAVSATTKGDSFYNSEDYQQFYNTGPDRNQDYIVTAEDGATLPTPIYNNMTSDGSVYNNATPDNPIIMPSVFLDTDLRYNEQAKPRRNQIWQAVMKRLDNQRGGLLSGRWS